MKLACAALLGTLVACSSLAQPSATSSTTPPPIANRGGSGSGGGGSGAAREVKLIPHRKMRIAVLGFEAVAGAAPNPTPTTVAKDFTDALRREAREDHDVTAVIGSRELIDEKMLHSCDDEAPACMSTIGKDLGADQILFGRVEERGPVFFVVAELLDIETKIEVQWTGTIQAQPADIQAAAHTAYVTLVGQVQ